MTTPEQWPEEKISAEAARRRDEVLPTLQPIVAGRPRRRRAFQVIAVLALSAASMGIWEGSQRGVAAVKPEAPRVAAQLELPSTPPTPTPLTPARAAVRAESLVTYVDTTPDLAASVSVATQAAERIDDAQLLAALEAAGQPPSLMRLEGRVVVAGSFHSVPLER